MDPIIAPVAPSNPGQPPPAAQFDTPTTYESSVAIIEAAISNSDSNVKDDALKKLKIFFTSRINKKSADDEKDGTGAVKRAMSSGRTFKPYERKTSTAVADSTPKGLFGT
jgi:hypothetical protein